MDFGALLQTAKQNEHSGKRDTRYYNTKFSAPKKQEKKEKTLSANIQKFLARKEAEEKQKSKEANRKKEELLALRSKDRKAQRRVSVMLKRTKSANQSVIQDAVDKDNTAVTLAGPSQPDEDDYGYVSQEAAAFYNKMMEKYSKMPEEPKFASAKKKASNNLSNTKDRVRAALEKEKEEAMLPHRRKRKHKEETGEQTVDEGEGDSYYDEQPPAKAKPKVAAPPPLNFNDLLKLAAQKQHEPIMIEVKPKEEEGPLMTKRQKREFEQEQQRKSGSGSAPTKPNGQSNRIPKTSSAQSSEKAKNPNERLENKSVNKSRNNFKVPNSKPDGRPKLNGDSSLVNRVPKSEVSLKARTENSSRFNDVHDKDLRISDRNSNLIKSQRPQVKQESLNRPTSDVKRKMPDERYVPAKVSEKKPINSKNMPESSLKYTKPTSSGADIYRKDFRGNNNNVREIGKQRPADSGNLRPKEFPPRDVQSKQFPPRDVQSKQFPPSDLRPKQFPPKDLKPRQFPPNDVRRKPPVNKRRILDDDDEYDSEMDDFIDDGPEDSEDYSKYIKDIFGYDKSRYRAADDDDIEEASFAQQMREDVRSTKIGIMEDLEDIKREKEEKRRKAMMKKRRL